MDVYRANGRLSDASEKEATSRVSDVQVAPFVMPSKNGGVAGGLSGGFRF